MSGMVGVLALGVALAGLVPSTAHAQKSINFFTSGSVRSTLVFTNQIVPDTYYFFATAGERIRVRTSNNAFDTTLRVVGPDASLSLFDDDSGGSLASSLTFYAADTGAYIVVVSSFSGNPGGGDYTLEFARGAAIPASSVASAAEDDTHNQTMDPGVNETHAK
jgi:hypothetical protein